LVIAATCALPRPSRAAGLYTHTWFVRRAIEKVELFDAQDSLHDYSGLVTILKKHQAVANYGALFPDVASKPDGTWGEYVTDNLPADMDIRHTYAPFVPPYEQRDRRIPNFRKAFIAELLPQFQHNPRTGYDEQMIAFLFGLIAHQEADIPWHLNDPAINVIGLEAAYSAGLADWLVELDVDNLLYHYDVNPPRSQEELVYFGFLTDDLKTIVRRVSGAAGRTAPWPIVIDAGQTAVEAAWGACTYDDPNGSTRDLAWVEGYPQGGIEHGAELIAIAWMRTWDLMAYSPPGKLDLDPPSISGAATTPPNARGWYTTSVTVHFTAEDALSGLDTVTPDQTLSAEGAGQSVVGTAVDRAWNRASHTVEPINIDLTPPVVDVTLDQARYTRMDPLIVHLSGQDPATGSGMASLTSTFNQQAVSDRQAVDLFWLPLDSHPLVARAEDQAGLVAEKSQNIEMYATIESLQGIVNRLCQESYITKSNTCTRLGARLDAALASRDRGDRAAAVRSIKTFQRTVKAQGPKTIPMLGASLLLADSDYVVQDLSYVPVPPGQAYVVKRGDWLMKVAKDSYGNPYLYRQIVEATNAKSAEDPSFLKIRNPHLIYRGQKLWIPTQPNPAP
jgi:LysM repeat protein